MNSNYYADEAHEQAMQYLSGLKMEKMPCSITDGPREDDYRDDYEIDEDTQFEEQREQAIEDRERFARSVTDDLVKELPDIMMLRDQA